MEKKIRGYRAAPVGEVFDPLWCVTPAHTPRDWKTASFVWGLEQEKTLLLGNLVNKVEVYHVHIAPRAWYK